MNDLLEKYFRGETSLTEEKELKHYFSTGNVVPEHEIYRPLFEVFELELEDIATSPLIKVIPKQRKIKQIWIKTFAYTGIAATLVVLFWVQLPRTTENYAVINGSRIDNQEFVQQYTEKKLSKVTTVFAKALKPMKSFEEIRENIEPIQNIPNIREKVDNKLIKLKSK